jgi:hypothetical protein
MTKAPKKTPNPNGRNGHKLKIEIPFEDAVAAALKVPAPKKPPPK